MSWGCKAEGSFRGTSAKTAEGGIQAECRWGTISLGVSMYNNLPKLVPGCQNNRVLNHRDSSLSVRWSHTTGYQFTSDASTGGMGVPNPRDTGKWIYNIDWLHVYIVVQYAHACMWNPEVNNKIISRCQHWWSLPNNLCSCGLYH